MEEQATCKEQRNMLVWVGFFLPLIIYLVIGVISILNDYIMCTCNRPCIQKTHTRKCLCLPGFQCQKPNQCEHKECTCTCTHPIKCLWPPGFEWNKTIIKLSTLTGTTFYYVGDNFFEKVDCNKNAPTVSLTLSVAGLLLYRVLPVALRKLKRYCEKEEGKHRSFHWCSPNSNETHSLVIAYTFLLSIVIDFDIVFTAVLDKIDDSNISCNKTVQSNIFWGLFGGMIGSFVFIQSVITAIFILTQCRQCISRWGCCKPICNSLLSKVKLILLTREWYCLIVIIIWDIVLSVTVPAAVIFYLLADNERVLQCFTSIPKDDESKYRIGFLSTSFAVCSLVLFGFLTRKLCCCVQIKGKITAVNIQTQEDGQPLIEANIQGDDQPLIYAQKDGQQLTVQVQNEVYLGDQGYSFNYNTATKEITSDNCDHAELYRNDIERFIKLPQKTSTIKKVSVHNDDSQITVRHNIPEQQYEVVFSTNDPASEGRIAPVDPPQAVALQQYRDAAAKALQQHQHAARVAHQKQQDAAEATLKQHWKTAPEALQKHWKTAAEALQKHWNTATEALQKQQEAASKALQQQWDTDASTLQKHQAAVPEAFQRQQDAVAVALEHQQDAAPQALQQHWNTAAEALQEHWNTAAEALQEHWNTAAEDLRQHWKKAAVALQQQLDKDTTTLQQQQDAASEALQQQQNADARTLQLQ